MKFSFLPALLVAVAVHAAEAPRLLPFQARLADATGKPIADGASVIQFQIFSEPTGGTPIWAGELHRVTVNGGLVNVVLGTKNPLPLNYPGDDSRPFFGSTLYLQATPDANGDGKITDDPPLLPRQAILPLLFASESAVSRTSLDSAKLAGRDWSAILTGGATDPTTGFLNGARLAPASVPGSKLLPGSVSGDALSIGAVQSAQIADGAVQLRHLEPRPTVFRSAPSAAVAVSTSSGEFALNGNSNQLIPGLELDIVSTGRPIMVQVQPDNSGDGSCFLSKQTEDGVNVRLVLYHGNEIIARERFTIGNAPGIRGEFWRPVGLAFNHFDARAGTHRYSLHLEVTGTGRGGVSGIRLVAWEL